MTRSTSGPSRSRTARSSARASASSAASSTPPRGARSSLTIWVSTGTSPLARGPSCRPITASMRWARGSSLIALREVVVRDLVAALAIKAEAAAALLLVGLFGGDDLEQPCKALEVRRALGAKVEQHLAARRGLRICAYLGGNEHRRLGGERSVRRAVRHEADRRPGPQHLVDAARSLGVGCVNEHALVLLQRLAGEAAGDLAAVLLIEVEINARHGRNGG